jgi:proline racemase
VSRKTFFCIDAHTCGNPVRVVAGGGPPLNGATMSEKRQDFIARYDWIRTGLMFEPRGHDVMSGSILYEPMRDDCDAAILFIETSGCLPMCGHGTIGVATVLVETGMVTVTEPVTTIRLDTPAGLVVAEVAVDDGAATAVTIRNVPSYSHRLDAEVEVAGFGTVRYDLAYGGNFYAMVRLEDLGLPFDRAHKQALLDAGLAIMEAIDKHDRPVHVTDPEISGCHHVQLIAPGSDARHSRHAMAIYPGWFDRSPCGTGTSARMAQLHARGELALHTDFVNESFIGTRFTGRLVEETQLAEGLTGVVPTITGSAWLTGTAQYFLDPTDPFPAGFLL